MLLTLLGLFAASTTDFGSGEEIMIVGLAPFGERHNYVGEGIKPAVQLALDDINRDEKVLPNHNLSISWIDTECDMAVTSKRLFDVYSTNRAHTFVFGGYCSSVTKPLAESMHHFNLWQVSYGNSDPTLSDKVTYPHFIRAIPSELDMSNALLGFIRHNNWSRVSILYQDASSGASTFAFSQGALQHSLVKKNITIVRSEGFSTEPSDNMDNIIKNDGRIIIGLFNEANARKIMCKAYHKRMYGTEYIWLLPLPYSERWWQEVADADCSKSQMREVVQGLFTVRIETLELDHARKTVNGKSSANYNLRYEEASGNHSSVYHGYAYDGMWLMAKLLDRATGGDDVCWSCLHTKIFIRNVSQIRFDGVTGQVSYANGGRQAHLSILRLKGEQMVRIGVSDMVNQKVFINTSLIGWHNGAPPSDSILRRVDMLKANKIYQVFLIALALLGQLLGLFFLAVNIRYRKTRVVKMSSPNMNNLIIIGSFLVYATIYMMRVDKDQLSDKAYETVCIAHAWFLSIGFTISFGAMFAKTWRVYSIFSSPHKQKRVIKDYTLALIVVGMTAMDLALLTTWTVVDPLRLKKIEFKQEKIDEVLVTSLLCTCKSDMMNIWTSSFYAYKGLLLVAGCWFAWNTRKVTVAALNDSKFIGLSVYNVVIMCGTAVAISQILSDKPDEAYLVVGLLIIVCTSTTLCLVFVPKARI
ncbi:gamma-aminobutyric acid type B receptor subunit 2-like [Watersipora subatra]|uniref:gamma-aminobutyric acid type B receptor subunit 2-like n=1 Tax=Watersipora subatra TaxID=2589382 RepID=UPI00355BE18B